MSRTYLEQCGTVLEECRKALERVNPDSVAAYLALCTGAKRIFFVGVGRVLLSLEAAAKRYAHLGLDTVVVGQITEPAITEGDVLIVGSGSGNTLFPSGIAHKAKTLGAKVIHIGYNPHSGLEEVADLFVRIPVGGKTCTAEDVATVQPMTSLFEQSLLLFGDITALMVVEDRKIDLPSLWRHHANLE